MSHFTGMNQEVHNYHTVDVPNSLKSNSSSQAIKCRNRIFQVSSTSQAQNSGGVVLFNIPPSNYSITRSSMALRARFTVTGTGLTGGDAAHSVGFNGPSISAALAAPPWVPQFGSGYSPISRMTLYGASSAVLEQLNYCNDNLTALLMHNSTPTYLAYDAEILCGVGAPWGYSTNGLSAQIDVVLPIPLSAFNSSTQDFPNYLLSAPLTLQIDLASVARALYKGGTATITDYQISNTYLVYQACELPAAFVEAERMAVKSSPFIMGLTSTLNVQVPQSLLSSYSLGINASSVRACMVIPSSLANYSVSSVVNFARDTVDASSNPAYNGAGTNAIVFVDGNQINSAIFDTPQMVFQGLKNCLHHNLQASILYSSPLTLAQYITNGYVIGWDMTSFDDESSLFAGTPCTTLNIQLTGYNNSGINALCTIVVVYDVLLAFEADGTIAIKR